MTEEVKEVLTKEDKIRIADDVVMTIAGIAASQVDCVTSMSGGFGDGIAGILGRKNLGKGVKVEVGDKEVAIDLSIIVEYGCKIHEVCRNIQNKAREAVEQMTGMTVSEVNVHVIGVNVDKGLGITEKDVEE